VSISTTRFSSLAGVTAKPEEKEFAWGSLSPFYASLVVNPSDGAIEVQLVDPSAREEEEESALRVTVSAAQSRLVELIDQIAALREDSQRQNAEHELQIAALREEYERQSADFREQERRIAALEAALRDKG
jgi:hypothetical protein